MTKRLLILILSAGAAAQQPFTPLLPQTWVNNLEYIGTTSQAIYFPASGTGGTWTCPGLGTFGPYTANTTNSLQTALNDAENCRNNGTGHPGTLITIPAGSVFSSASTLLLPQTPGDDPGTKTNFIVLQSSNPLPLGVTVCAHGLAAQDNVPESQYPALRNLGCNGSKLSYQLGIDLYYIPSGTFAYANGTTSNTANFNDISHMYTLEVTSTGGSSNVISNQIDSNSVSSHHFAILNAEIRPQVGIAAVAAPIGFGSSAGAQTSPTMFTRHVHFAYDYIHGDVNDAVLTSGVGGSVTYPPEGGNGLANAVMLNSCIYCSFSYVYFDKILRPGGEGHIIGCFYLDGLKIVHSWLEGSSINMICGGQTGTLPLQSPFASSLEIRGNRLTYPYSWILGNRDGYYPNSAFATTGGSGTGAMVRVPSSGGVTSTGGCLFFAQVETAGTGYVVGDMFTLNSNVGSPNASGGTMAVTSVDANGGVTGVQVASGSGYSVGTNLPTTVQTNCITSTTPAGTGATVDITRVTPTGAIVSINLNNPGSGYAVNNVLIPVQAGGSGGTLRIGSVSSGAIVTVSPVSGRNYQNGTYYKKNAYEMKMGYYQLLDGNEFENNDYSGGQGYQILLRATNASAGNWGNNYTGTTTDITITNNIVRNGCAGPALGTRSAGAQNGGGATFPSWRMLYSNNLLYNVGTSNPGCSGAPAGGIVMAWGGPNSGIKWVSSAVEDTTGTLATFTLDPVASNPSYNPPGMGYNESTISVGDPVLVTGCSGGTNPTGFNQSGTCMAPTAGAACTPLAITPTLPSGLTVYVPWTATPSSTATGCTVNYGMGWPNFMRNDHDSDFLTSGGGYDIGSNCSGGANQPYCFVRNLTWTNSISAGSNGIGNSTNGEGTRSQIRGFDPNSQVMHHLALTQRNSVSCPGGSGINGCYSAWDDNFSPIVPPNSTIFGTSTPYCPGNDPTAGDCLGVVGLMNTSACCTTVLENWHMYRLCHAGDVACSNKPSLYAAGGARQAADGTDLGVNFSAIELAQTRSQYPAAGAYPDYPGGGTAPPPLTHYRLDGPNLFSGLGTWK